MATHRMRFAVLGPGGVGGLLAALLARAGDDVIVLAGEQTARAIAAGGLTVESGRFGTFTARVRTAGQLDDHVDAVLVTVKATQLEQALERVAPTVLGDAVIVPFLNGLDHVDLLRRRYGPDRVVPATIRVETTKVGVGLIRHTSPFVAVDIGAAAANVGERLAATGIDVRVRDDELAMLWEKFAVLAPMALLTTHDRAPAGEVRTSRRREMEALVREFAAVAAAEGVTIDASRTIRFIDSVPETMETSMQRDRAAGRPLELDALGGALLRRAARANIDVPVATKLVLDIGAASTSS